MCRLFAMTAGTHPVSATFWLLGAPDSLADQSKRNPDGTGLGVFDTDGRPQVLKEPMPAYEDADFVHEARDYRSTVFLGHVRYSTGTELTPQNTHPFVLDDRLFAHNGAIGGIDALEDHLGEDMSLVRGDTDSERIFALITREIRRADGDVLTGLRTAMEWISQNVPVFAANVILATAHELWALRWPDTHDLYTLQRPAASEHLSQRSTQGTRIESSDLASAPSVIVASEKMDDADGWQMIPPGQLVHITAELDIERIDLLDPEPARRLTADEVESS